MHAEIIPDFTGADIRYIARVNGAEVGRFYTYAAADAAITPDYSALLDCAGPDVPLDGPSVEEEGGEGGEPPPDEWRALTSEQRGEIDHLCACADGQHILDWAMVDALEAHVRRALRDLAAAPDSPAPSPLPTAPAGGDAASAAGPCDVSGCRAPGSTVWLGRWPAYPARLCGAHRKTVAP